MLTVLLNLFFPCVIQFPNATSSQIILENLMFLCSLCYLISCKLFSFIFRCEMLSKWIKFLSKFNIFFFRLENELLGKLLNGMFLNETRKMYVQALVVIFTCAWIINDEVICLEEKQKNQALFQLENFQRLNFKPSKRIKKL